MSRAEDYITQNTKTLEEYGKEYFKWLTPDQARRAVEIAREETTEKIERLLKKNYLIKSTEPLRWVSWEKVFNAIKLAMKDE